MRQLAENQVFKGKRELNETVSRHSERHRYELNKTDFAVLTYISQHAVKFSGAAQLKNITIADDLGISERTVRRSTSKLDRLGIVERRKYIRPVKIGRGANLYIIRPFEDDKLSSDVHAELSGRPTAENVDVPTVEADNSATEPYSFLISKDLKDLKDINTYVKPSSGITDADKLKNLETIENTAKNPYQKFREFVEVFTDDTKLMYKLYGVFIGQTKNIRHNYESSDLIDVAIESLKVAFIATKTRTIRNLAGFFNGVLANKLDEHVNGKETRTKSIPKIERVATSELARTGIIVDNGKLVYPESKVSAVTQNTSDFGLLNNLIAKCGS